MWEDCGYMLHHDDPFLREEMDSDIEYSNET
jgi:hypothetical protein